MSNQSRLTLLLLVFTSLLLLSLGAKKYQPAKHPNILFCISDDQSWLHTGAMGDPIVHTPAFDRIAREGILFTHAFCDAPSCGPSRSAILTGQHIWRLEEAANIHSKLPDKFPTYTQLLEDNGYVIGSYSKAWSPGKFKVDTGWVHNSQTKLNPAGFRYESFADFYQKRNRDQPFCFWLGSTDAHRPYDLNSGRRSGMDPGKVTVPQHLPDNSVVRNDILDYYFEIQRFDQRVAEALSILEANGELQNTVVVVTSDNGMPFPRAKATLYDFGTHMPLAIRWPDQIVRPGRNYDGFVHLSDLAATFLEAAGLVAPNEMTSKSLMNIFTMDEKEKRSSAFTAMERHDGCRIGGKGYPCRAVRTKDFLYIYNYEPDRWPAGNPDAKYCARAIPFGEVDPCPTKQQLLDKKDGYPFFYQLAFDKRPLEELYDLRADPNQINNVADIPEYQSIRQLLNDQLMSHTTATNDPRALGEHAPWDHFPYYGQRKNKDWKVE